MSEPIPEAIPAATPAEGQDSAYEYLDRLRLCELSLLLDALPHEFAAGARLLEVGAGTGVQSAKLANRGLQVSAIDLAQSLYAEHRAFTVTDYDGVHLPYPDASFDLVYSSNVMEHVTEFGLLQAQLTRVLAAQGQCVHLVPSGGWALLTWLGYWVSLPLLLKKLNPRRNHNGETSATNRTGSAEPAVKPTAKRNWWRSLKLRFIPSPHGEFAQHLPAEVVAFSKRAWEQRFTAAGWQTTQCFKLPLVYTGHALLGPKLSFTRRQQLARWLPGACYAFVLIPQVTQHGAQG